MPTIEDIRVIMILTNSQSLPSLVLKSLILAEMSSLHLRLSKI